MGGGNGSQETLIFVLSAACVRFFPARVEIVPSPFDALAH